MAKKETNPFKEFAERSEEIRKMPLDEEKIRKINELSRKIEREEEEEAVSDKRQIACGGPSRSIEA